MTTDDLHDVVLLKIIHHLPLKDQTRIARVSKRFHMLSLLAVSETKSLRFYDPDLKKLTPGQLVKLASLCAGSLQRIDDYGTAANRSQRLELLSQFSLPRLVTLEAVYVRLSDEAVKRLFRNCPSLKCLMIRIRREDDQAETDDPDGVNEKLEELCMFDACNSSLLRWMTLRCPNLKMFAATVSDFSTENFDAHFANCTRVESIIVGFPVFSDHSGGVIGKDLVNFWKLTALRVLHVEFRTVDSSFMFKVAEAFPLLEELFLKAVGAINSGITALGRLKNLSTLALGDRPDNHYVNALVSQTIDDGVRSLAKCSLLNFVSLRQLKLSASTVSYLIHSCPALRSFYMFGLTDVETVEETVVFVQSFHGIGLGHMEIVFLSEEAARMWHSTEVQTAIGEINQAAAKSKESGDW